MTPERTSAHSTSADPIRIAEALTALPEVETLFAPRGALPAAVTALANLLPGAAAAAPVATSGSGSTERVSVDLAAAPGTTALEAAVAARDVMAEHSPGAHVVIRVAQIHRRPRD